MIGFICGLIIGSLVTLTTMSLFLVSEKSEGNKKAREINTDLCSLTISRDDWHFTTTELKTLYDNGYPIEECVRLIIVQAQDEFAKILLSSNE